MSNNPVERYEQMLASDPTSPAFVELAKSLLEQGEVQRAIEVCQQGVMHHGRSVVGRVLWGKALIQLGRPAEAMEQFDRAVAVDKENAHAYNLIGEVLIQKGLYRSALPLLRKAVALQPNDERIRQWFEQTQAALNGGPAPQLGKVTLLADAKDAEPALEPQPWPKAAPAPAPEPADAPQAGSAVASPSPSAPLAPMTAGGPGGLQGPPILLRMEDAAPPSPAPPAEPGLLDDLPLPPEGTAPQPPPELPPALEHAQAAAGADEDSLLGDIPTLTDPGAAPAPAEKVKVSAQAAAAIAQAYERELRERLEIASQEKSFLQQHGLKLALGTVVGLVILAGLSMFFITRARNHGKDLNDALALAKKAFLLDTAAGYRQGLVALHQAVEMDASSQEAWALTAYGESILFAEHGGSPEDKRRAVEALEQPGLEASQPAYVLAARYEVATPAEREVAARAVLQSRLDLPELKELAGRILLQKRDVAQAVKSFKRALELFPNNVRALVALGNYYKDAGDSSAALSFYDTAAQLSPLHAERAVAAAEVRLSLGQDLKEALTEIERLPAKDELSADLAARKAIVHGRLLAFNGSAAQAVAELTSARAATALRPVDFDLALGEAHRMAGQMPQALADYQVALRLQPRNEGAREGLGRVLLAEDRPREVLAQLSAQDSARNVVTVRAAAYAAMGNWKMVRAELQRTQVNGKFPAASVMYLALADAAEGQAERAQGVLEKALLSVRHGRGRGELALALGQVYWQRGILDKARAQFEEAMKDPLDYEGGCSLGRLLIQNGALQKALEPLELSVARDGSHGEARHALGRLYLELGRPADGLGQAQAWVQADPAAAGATKDLAFALYHSGRFKEAEAAVNRAVRVNGKDPEAHLIKSDLMFARGDGKGGFKELERANRLDPANAEIFCAIGRAFLRQANWEGASKAFDAALRQSSSAACGKIGKDAVRLVSAAKPAARELAQLSRGAPAAWDRAWATALLARADATTGSPREALRLADAALATSPIEAEAYYAQGLAGLKLKDTNRALDGLSKAVAYQPTTASYHLALADFLVRTDDGLARALPEYQLFLKLAKKGPEQARVKRMLPQLRKRLARH